MTLRSTYLRPPGLWILAEPGTSTGTVTDASSYYPAAGFWLTTPPWASGLQIVTTRTADTGTCTMDVFVEHYNPITEAYSAVQDAAGNDLAGVQYTNDQTGERVIRIHPAPINVDADGVLVVNTVDKWFQQSAPQTWRVRVLSGGTSVANVFSMYAFPLV